MSLERAFDPLRSLELTDAEVATVLARSRRDAPRRRVRRVVLTVTVAAAAAVAAGSAGRAGLDDAIERFFAGGPPPGDRAPLAGLSPHLRARGAHVVARDRGERLIAYRAPSGAVCFQFGDHVGVCTPYDKDSLFRGSSLVVWGPTHRDERGRWVLWGLALDVVARVELRYEDGPASGAQVRNGFVLRADRARRPTELVAFDRQGRKLTAIDVRERFRHAPVGG